ncbi:MAG: NUDIX hydrolase [Bryobacteraceae bacterium]
MDAREQLAHLLDRHRPHDPAEADMLVRLAGFVRSDPHALDWRNSIGHVTGSAWVLDPTGARVLLTFHRKLERWLQLGGHVEDDETVPAAALREAHEESGLNGIVLAAETVFDVDIHAIPATPKRAAHLHYDVRFLCLAPAAEPRPNEESREVRWVPLDEVSTLNPDASMIRMLAKTPRAR